MLPTKSIWSHKIGSCFSHSFCLSPLILQRWCQTLQSLGLHCLQVAILPGLSQHSGTLLQTKVSQSWVPHKTVELKNCFCTGLNQQTLDGIWSNIWSILSVGINDSEEDHLKKTCWLYDLHEVMSQRHSEIDQETSYDRNSENIGQISNNDVPQLLISLNLPGVDLLGDEDDQVEDGGDHVEDPNMIPRFIIIWEKLFQLRSSKEHGPWSLGQGWKVASESLSKNI